MSDEQVAALEATLAERTAQANGLKAQQEFLRLDVNWKDRDLALAQADLSDCVGEDGTVDVAKVEKAARALAFEKPYLVHTILDEPLLPSQPSGLPVGSGRNFRWRTFNGRTFDEEALRRKYNM